MVPLTVLQADRPPDGRGSAEIPDAILPFEFDWSLLLYDLSSLVVAFLLALPVAWDRERKRSSPGLRTFPLVAMSSCAYILITRTVLDTDTEALGRSLQGLAMGIGFIGGGAILKSHHRVTGTATAAGIWTMGALGAAVALRRIEVAMLLSLATLGTFRLLQPFKEHVVEGD